jgi:20S proteasome alpha/beta subunit
MTTICYKGGVMAADKQATSSGCKHGKMTKIFKINGHLIGCAGDGHACMEMIRWFTDGAKPDEFPDIQKDEDNGMLMVVTPEGKIQFYEKSFLPVQYENDFAAMGSGRDFALGAMASGLGAVQAVEVAISFDIYSGNGVDWLPL